MPCLFWDNIINSYLPAKTPQKFFYGGGGGGGQAQKAPHKDRKQQEKNVAKGLPI